MRHDSAVLHYVKGMAQVPVYFANGQICCAECIPFCRYEAAYQRYVCRALRIKNRILDPMSGILENCPIVFEEEERKCL